MASMDAMGLPWKCCPIALQLKDFASWIQPMGCNLPAPVLGHRTGGKVFSSNHVEVKLPSNSLCPGFNPYVYVFSQDN